MDREPARLRHFRPDDLDDLYRICLRTADNGQDATGLFQDPRLPGDVYVAPYVTFEPSLAFVAEDGAGVGGYIVAWRTHHGHLPGVRLSTRTALSWPVSRMTASRPPGPNPGHS